MDTSTQRSVDSLERLHRPEGIGFFTGLEGCDGAGKTTVANELRQLLGWPIFHRHPSFIGYDPKLSLGMELAALKLYDDIGFNVIEERTFLGYDVYNNNQWFNKQYREMFVNLVSRRKKYLYVFLSAPLEVVLKRLEKKNETVLNIKNELAMYEYFFAHIHEHEAYKNLNVLTVDATQSPKDIAHQIMLGMVEVLEK